MTLKELLAGVTAYFVDMEKTIDDGEGALHYCTIPNFMFDVFQRHRYENISSKNVSYFLEAGWAIVQFLSGLSEKSPPNERKAALKYFVVVAYIYGKKLFFILSIRLYAVYGGSRALMLVLGIFLLTGIAGICTIIGLINFSAQATSPGVTGCWLVIGSPRFLPYVWIFPIYTETILCGFMVYKTYTIYRSARCSTLLVILTRDSVVVVMLINCIIWSTKDTHNYLAFATGTLASVGRLQSAPQWVVVSS
ncbi:hypothetical protein BU17DRAFT_70789 [Hysterangium stoloniferum]|nr:hypothetical protein BU17DRAFT_70789 [Hysterangium stoloniferum]